VKHSPNCILIVVTNPLDAMAQAAFRVSGFPKTACLAWRGAGLRANEHVCCNECKVSVETCTRSCWAAWRRHVPLPRYSAVAGIPLPICCRKSASTQSWSVRAKAGGDRQSAEDRSAYYAPSAAAVEMVEAILKDKKKILPCAAYLDGEYGIKGLFVACR